MWTTVESVWVRSAMRCDRLPERKRPAITKPAGASEPGAWIRAVPISIGPRPVVTMPLGREPRPAGRVLGSSGPPGKSLGRRRSPVTGSRIVPPRTSPPAVQT